MIRQGGNIILSQGHYAKEVLVRNGMETCNTVKVILDAAECEEQPTGDGEVSTGEIRLAQAAVGELLWLSTRTRPDLSYSVQRMASYATSDPQRTLRMHKRVLRFL